MKTSSLSLYALRICVAVPTLVGCGGSSPPIGAPGAIPQSMAVSGNAGRSPEFSRLASRAKQILVWLPPSSSHFFAIGAFPATGNGSLTPTTLISGDKPALYGVFESTLFQTPQGRVTPPGRLFTCSKDLKDHALHILAFAARAHGDVAPVRNIGGSNNPLQTCRNVAADGVGRVAASAGPYNTIFLWSAALNGNAKPSQTLAGDATKLDNPRGLGFNRANDIYVVNDGYPFAYVTVYARDASGNTPPLREIDGYKTRIERPVAMAVSGDMIYVSNQGLGPPSETEPHITAYNVSQSGDVEPTILIEGPKTRLYHLMGGIGVDAAGYIYVNTFAAGRAHILAFAPGATGDVAPVQDIRSRKRFFDGQIALR